MLDQPRRRRDNARPKGRQLDDTALAENIKALVDAIVQAKPTGAKGTYLQKVSLSSSMGPGVSVELASITGA